MTNPEQNKIERGVFTDIKLALFDVGGVLFRFTGGLEALSELTNYPYERCKDIWLEMDDSICRGKVHPQELWNRIKQESKYEGNDIDFVSFWVNHFQPNKQVHTLIRDISKNCPLGLITNIYPGVYQRAIESGNIPDVHYDLVIKSCDIGFVKPEIEMYEIAQAKSGLQEKEILFIDDNAKFIVPAKNLGWKTLTFNTQSPGESVETLRMGFAF